jgi:CHASE1-domain containing sensor protein
MCIKFDNEIERLVESVKSKQREFDNILNSMRQAFSELIKQKEHTESRFFDLNLRIEELQKDLNVSRLIQ